MTLIKDYRSNLTMGLFFVMVIFFNGTSPLKNNHLIIDHPNIVWLVTEDNSIDYLKLYNEFGASMPHIESLAKKGITFTRAFSQAPVCSVARSTIISGCYAPRIGAQYHRRMAKVPMPNNLKMFPSYLRSAGYYTTNNSKEDYNIIKSDDVWNESSKTATYRNRSESQPFFHVQNFGITHEGRLHFSEELMNQKSTDHDTKESHVFPYHPDTEIYKYTVAKYLDLHQQADKAIGAFLNQMKEDGVLENTIVFYYGDHGGVLPRSKGYIYESGLHVPLVVQIPKKWQHLSPYSVGSRSDAFVRFIDLGPTVLNLAGIDVPTEMDGKPFLGEGITKSQLDQRNSVFSYADRFDEKYDLVRSIRKGNLKYIRNYQPFNIDGLFNFYRYKMLAYQEWQDMYQSGNLNRYQSQFFQARDPEGLYDLEADPYEIKNLALNPAYSKVLMEFRKELQIKVKELPDLSFYPESYFLEYGLDNPVAFGQVRKQEISQLVDIADLTLQSFEDVKKDVKKALKSKDPWKRYWGLIACTTFGEEASIFEKKIKKIITRDPESLVRIRAIEFMHLNSMGAYESQMIDLVTQAKNKTEANLILNSVALIKFLNPDLNVKIDKKSVDLEWVKIENDLVNRRLDYINSF